MIYIHKLDHNGGRKRAGKGFETMKEVYEFIGIQYLFHDDYEIEVEVDMLHVYSKWNSNQKYRALDEYEITGREEIQITYRVYQWESNRADEPHSSIGDEWQFESYEDAMGWFHKMVDNSNHKVEVIPMIDPETEQYYEGHRNQFVVLEFYIGAEYTCEVYQIYVEEIPCK